MISQVTLAMALYSASAEERDTVCYFLDFQEINESPRKTQKPLIDLLVSGQVAQSESTKAFNCIEDVEGKKTPCPGVVFTY